MAWTAHTIIQNGRAIPFEAAQIHPFSVGLAYGAAVFEGIRAYLNPATGRLSVFRPEEHLVRLDQGIRSMRFDDPPSRDVLRQGVMDAIRANAPDDDCYIRLQVHIGSRGSMATTGTVGRVCAAIARERSARRESGLAAGVSSWVRIADNTMPARIKATANCHAGRIATLQARADGYDTPILLTREGKVSETAGACLFMVRDGVVITPARDSDILESVTRDTVLELARENGLPTQERRADRTELHVAEEVFVCGTGQELLPVTSIARLAAGDGRPGAITRRLQAAYESVVRGTTDAHAAWRTPVV